MFDDVFGVMERCTDTFRSGVNDTFGASIIADLLDPIQNQIGLLRSLHADLLRQSLNIEQILQDVRSITLAEGSSDEHDTSTS